MKVFFVKPAQPDPTRLPFENIAMTLNWRRLFAVAVTAALTALLHGVLLIWYLNRPAPAALTEAIPLPMIDIALASPNTDMPAKTEPPKPEVKLPEQKPKPKLKPKPVKKPKVKSEIKKPQIKPETRPVETAQAAVSPLSRPAPVTPAATSQADSHPQHNAVANDTPAHADANYLNNPKPAYPRIARQRHWEGRLVLRVYVTADGRCGDLSVYRSSGHESLDESALAAVRQWRFMPGKHGDAAIASWVNVPIEFTLE